MARPVAELSFPTLMILACLSGCGGEGPPAAHGDAADWPRITSNVPVDPALEERVDSVLSQLTLEQKVGQMVQAEINNVTLSDVGQYHLGSILSGPSSPPNRPKASSDTDWLALADAFYDASMDTSQGGAAIPVIWGTDAVHGHNNVIGATLFPHNIGLGATRDPELIQRIGEATALEVAATGIDWTFAPTLAVVRDDRWGRTYEGYSEDPEIVGRYAGHPQQQIMVIFFHTLQVGFKPGQFFFDFLTRHNNCCSCATIQTILFRCNRGGRDSNSHVLSDTS